MPAKSKKQQRFMGMVYHCKETGDCASKEVEEAADSIKKKDVRDFAKTKHKGLPEKVRKKKNKKRKKKGGGKKSFLILEDLILLSSKFKNINLRKEAGYIDDIINAIED